MEVDAPFGGAGASRGVQPERRIVPTRGLGDAVGSFVGEQLVERQHVGAVRLADHDDLAKTPMAGARDVLHLRQQRRADDEHAGAHVVEQVAVIRFFQKRVDGHCDRADLERAKKCVGKCRLVQQQQHDPFFRAHIQPTRAAHCHSG